MYVYIAMHDTVIDIHNTFHIMINSSIKSLEDNMCH